MQRVLIITILVLGCATFGIRRRFYNDLTSRMKQGQYGDASLIIESHKEKIYGKNNRVLYYLDRGTVLHWKGDYKKSNLYLEHADRTIEELFTRSISRGAASFLLSDNVMEYAGEDYENLYLNILKALNYYHKGNLDAAMVEIRRLDEKLKILAYKYEELVNTYNRSDDKIASFKLGESRFHNSALARYLSMLFYRAKRMPDNSRIDQNKIKEAWQTQSHIYNFPIPEAVDRALSPAQKARLNFIAFAGWGPKKHERVLYIHTEENMVLVYTSDTYSEEALLDIFPFPVSAGYHFKFALPFIKRRPSKIGSIGVRVDGREVGSLQLLEDISEVAIETYKLREPIIYLKSITRTIMKGLTSHLAKKELTEGDDAGIAFLKRSLVDIAVGATEKADLRTWNTMPGKCYIGEFEIVPGVYDITVDYYADDGSLIRSYDFPDQKIERGKLNLFETALYY